MKRILALVNSYQSEIRDRQYDIILEQVKSYSLEMKITLLHMIRHDEAEKELRFETEDVSSNLKVVTVHYTLGRPRTFRQKFNATIKLMGIGRMVTNVLMEKEEYDQIHLHESWPLIMLGREIHLLKKLPFFLFEYDNDYIYSSYRRKNKLTIFPYLAVLFSAHGIQKIFGHTPKLIKRLASNLNAKNKAVIIPLAVDTNHFKSKGEESRTCIFSELNSETEKEMDIVFHILQEFTRIHPEITVHLLLKTPSQIEVFSKYIKPENLVVHDELSDEKKSNYLRQSLFTVILDDNLQEIQLMNQSLCCGTPILSRASVAIIEDLNDNNSQIMNEDDSVLDAMNQMVGSRFDNKSIAKNAKSKYSHQVVSQILYREIRNY